MAVADSPLVAVNDAVLLVDVTAERITDEFLSLPVALLARLTTAAQLCVALLRPPQEFDERPVPLMGGMAAFIFAARMITFSVAGGTPGHLLGGAPAASTPGPWTATLIMESVIGVRALVFQDGGLVVMRADILSMDFLTAFITYDLYRAATGWPRGWRLAEAGGAA